MLCLSQILRDDSEAPVKMRCNLTPIRAGGSIPSSGIGSAFRPNISSGVGPAVSVETLAPNSNRNLFVFTSCGQEFGRFGPTEQMCNQTYRNTNVRVTVKDGIQVWSVPKDGRYRIEAKAPAGQQHIQRYAGRGATVAGEFDLALGTKMKV